jgi:Family of unknown function (DUF6427)
VTGTFKVNNPYNNFLLFLYALIIKLPIFLHPVVVLPQSVDGVLYAAFLKWISPIGIAFPLIYAIIPFVLLYTQALSFNKLVNVHRLTQKPNYLTGLSYLTITSLFTPWSVLSATLIVNTFIIWVWAAICGLHSNTNAKSTLFNIGIAIGICTFFYFPSIAFLVLVIISLAFTRAIKIAEWLLVLFGIVTPYYFLAAFIFLTDNIKSFRLPSFAITYPKFQQTSLSLFSIIFILIIAAIGFVYIQQNFKRQLIQARKSWALIFLYLVIALFIPFINATHNFDYWVVTAVPLAAMIGAAFLYLPKPWMALTLHWIMIGLVIANSFFSK